jgi:hypothetical protein
MPNVFAFINGQVTIGTNRSMTPKFDHNTKNVLSNGTVLRLYNSANSTTTYKSQHGIVMQINHATPIIVSNIS